MPELMGEQEGRATPLHDAAQTLAALPSMRMLSFSRVTAGSLPHPCPSHWEGGTQGSGGRSLPFSRIPLLWAQTSLRDLARTLQGSLGNRALLRGRDLRTAAKINKAGTDTGEQLAVPREGTGLQRNSAMMLTNPSPLNDLQNTLRTSLPERAQQARDEKNQIARQNRSGFNQPWDHDRGFISGRCVRGLSTASWFSMT